jgi:nitronate monooxygenase
MSLPPILQRLRLPVIGAPLFIVSKPEAGDRPVHGGDRRQLPGAQRPAPEPARRMAARDHEALAAWDRDHPDRPAAPFAVNQIVHRSNDRLEHDMATCAKWKVPIVITSLGAR